MAGDLVLHLNPGQQVLAALIAAIGALLAGLIAATGRRVTAAAAKLTAEAAAKAAEVQAQATLNEAFTRYTKELQQDREHHHSRLNSCERETARMRAIIVDLEGRVANQDQEIRALENIMRRAGLEVPERREVATIVLLDSQGARSSRTPRKDN